MALLNDYCYALVGRVKGFSDCDFLGAPVPAKAL